VTSFKVVNDKFALNDAKGKCTFGSPLQFVLVLAFSSDVPSQCEPSRPPKWPLASWASLWWWWSFFQQFLSFWNLNVQIDVQFVFILAFAAMLLLFERVSKCTCRDHRFKARIGKNLIVMKRKRCELIKFRWRSDWHYVINHLSDVVISKKYEFFDLTSWYLNFLLFSYMQLWKRNDIKARLITFKHKINCFFKTS